MSYLPAGQPSDFTKDITVLLQEFLQLHYGISDPPKEHVKFGTTWYNGLEDYQIHLANPRYDIRQADLGWKRQEFNVYVDLHIFAKRTSEFRPSQFHSMQREILRIVQQKRTLVGQGVQFVKWARDLREITPRDVHDETWHMVGTLHCFYHMVDLS
jgi:hypothetical protein